MSGCNDLIDPQRLYVDGKTYGGKTNYIILDGNLFPAIWKKFPHLSNTELRVFTYIITLYENGSIGKYCPISLSYNDICKVVCCKYSTVREAVAALTQEKLIIDVTEERKGRSKKRYKPNVQYIHQLIKKYVLQA